MTSPAITLDEAASPRAGGDVFGAPRWVPAAILGLVMAVGVGVILHAGRNVTFVIDEWQFLMHRTSPSAASLLEPFNNHLMAVPIAINQVLYRIFGIESHVPYRVVLLAVHLAVAGLLFVYIRRRAGDWLALAVASVFVLYGYTAAIIIWPISTGWAIAMAGGIGALLLIDRDDRRGDVGAAVLLMVALASTTAAVAFPIGVVVELVVRRSWKRLWVPLAPLAVYGVWYLAYQTGTGDRASAGTTARFAQELVAQTVGSLLGIQDRGAAADVAMVVVLLAVVGLWFLVGRPLTPRLVGNASALLAFTVLLAVGRASTGLTTWFSYAEAVFLLLTVAELLVGQQVGRLATGVVLAVAAWSIVWNLGQLSDGGARFRKVSRAEQAALAATELARGRVADDFAPDPLLMSVTAGNYFDVADEYGSPAFTVAETRATSPDARRLADDVLVRALGIEGAPAAAPEGACARVVQLGSGRVPLRPRADTVFVQAGDAPATVRLGAFAAPKRVVAEIPAGETRALALARVPGAPPWELTVDGAGAKVCGFDVDRLVP